MNVTAYLAPIERLERMPTQTVKLIAGTALLITSAIAYVLIALFGDSAVVDARGVFLFILPVVTGLFISGGQDTLKETTSRIEKNTNGVLTAKIDNLANTAAENAVAKVLASAQAKETIAERIVRHDAEPNTIPEVRVNGNEEV